MSGLQRRLALVAGTLVVLNAGAWSWALVALHGKPAALGVAALVYGLGLRHAVDVDHIAAIDAITRKLMQEGQRPVAVGFFFALGHSLIVVAVTALVVAVKGGLERIGEFRAIGGTVSTLVSALFLFAVALMNVVIFVSVRRRFARLRAGAADADPDIASLLENRGLLARLVRPLFRLVTKSWHMAPLGFVFGLGFDTATEVAVFGIAAGQAVQGATLASVLVFPALFAAGMALVDTADGIVMVGIYDWALVDPLRKLRYNMAITLASVVVALVIGSLETLALIAGKFDLRGAFWTLVATVGAHLNVLGFALVGLFALIWGLSFAVHRMRADGSMRAT
ncbi:HoxN/HupN/NixA family nickel/cobalt transporter [Dokdonella sp.]|uniref:HoxN/HupN/NixA family nickel/cobalt transporter n=1 Tax=Dokdonella sp. TaxID=2291710 RepID=UPI002F41124E